MGNRIMPSIIRATTTSGLQITPDNSGSLQLQTNGTTTALTIDTSQNVGIGTTSPAAKLVSAGSSSTVYKALILRNGDGTTNSSATIDFEASAGTQGDEASMAGRVSGIRTGSGTSGALAFSTTNAGTLAERMRIDSSGLLRVGSSSSSATAPNNASGSGYVCANLGSSTVLIDAAVSGGIVALFNRAQNDGTIVSLRQDSNEEGSISVSGTTVSYNGGHLSRWSQWQNETGKPNVYRGSVLESVDAMCEWEKDGQPLPNEQATKTIVSTTVASKAVAGVFDRYDEDDENNPYDFYVAQSGDFVIRIAQGVTVQNGDLLESAGDGTAKPQTDDICRSSTIAKVTSNYVSATYEDGSYCVPCILMIG